jgi:peptidoglycan/xylan/chitin deacetylase (PgdA/CDA1 family)
MKSFAKKVLILLPLFLAILAALIYATAKEDFLSLFDRSYENVLKSYKYVKRAEIDDYFKLTAAAQSNQKKTGSANIKDNSGAFRNVPILTYHCIDDNIFGVQNLFISPGVFDRQMRFLKDAGYTPIIFEQIESAKNIRKPVLITFDDGYENNYTNAYPILKKYKFRATIFLISNAIGNQHFLNKSEISKMGDLINFQDHTLNHPNLANVDKNRIGKEISQSKAALQSMVNNKIFVLAYPYGSYNMDVLGAAKKYYKYALAIDRGIFYESKGNYYELRRIMVFRETSMQSFVKALNF